MSRHVEQAPRDLRWRYPKPRQYPVFYYGAGLLLLLLVYGGYMSLQYAVEVARDSDARLREGLFSRLVTVSVDLQKAYRERADTRDFLLGRASRELEHPYKSALGELDSVLVGMHKLDSVALRGRNPPDTSLTPLVRLVGQLDSVVRADSEPEASQAVSARRVNDLIASVVTAIGAVRVCSSVPSLRSVAARSGRRILLMLFVVVFGGLLVVRWMAFFVVHILRSKDARLYWYLLLPLLFLAVWLFMHTPGIEALPTVIMQEGLAAPRFRSVLAEAGLTSLVSAWCVLYVYLPMIVAITRTPAGAKLRDLTRRGVSFAWRVASELLQAGRRVGREQYRALLSTGLSCPRLVWASVRDILGHNAFFYYFLDGVFEAAATQIVLGLVATIAICVAPLLYISGLAMLAPAFTQLPWHGFSLPYQQLCISLALIVLGALYASTLLVERGWPATWPLLGAAQEVLLAGVAAGIVATGFVGLIRTAGMSAVHVLYSIQVPELPAHLIITAPGAVVSSFVIWLAPLIAGVMTLEDVYERRTAMLLRRILQQSRRHAVVYGFGDFGKHAVASLFGTSDRHGRRERYKFAPVVRVLSSRSGSFVKVLTEIAVVDKNANVFAELHGDSMMGQIGLGKVEVRGSRDEQFYVPGVVGECDSSVARDRVNADLASIVVLAARDAGAVMPTYWALPSRRRRKADSIFGGSIGPDAVLGAEDGSFIQFLEWQRNYASTVFMYPAQLRGTVVGRIVLQSLLRMPVSAEGKMLIVGAGRQLYYLIEKLWLELPRYTGQASDSEMLLSKIVLLSDDPFLIGASRDDAWLTRKLGRDARVLPVPLTARSGVLSDELPTVTLIAAQPHNSTVLTELLHTGLFENVVVLQQSSEETLEAVHESVSTLALAVRNGKTIPSMVVGVRSADQHSVADSMFYMRSLADRNGRTPTLQRDACVDLHEDMREMLDGLLSTVLTKRSVELALCTYDGVGQLLSLTARLSGMKAIPSRPARLVPSVSDYRSVDLRPDGFYFTGIGTLEPLGALPDSALDYTRRASIDADVASDLTVPAELLGLGLTRPPAAACAQTTCPEVRYCQIRSLERHLGCRPANRDEGSEPRLFYAGPERTSQSRARARHAPAAEMMLCSRASAEPGRLCRALAGLLLCTLQEISNSPRVVLDIKHARSQLCSRPDVTLKRIWGNLTERAAVTGVGPSFDVLLLRRFGPDSLVPDSWDEYVDALIEFLGDGWGRWDTPLHGLRALNVTMVVRKGLSLNAHCGSCDRLCLCKKVLKEIRRDNA